MIAYIRKALTSAAISGIGTTLFAATSDGKIDQPEIAAIVGVVLGAFGLTWLIPNAPTPNNSTIIRP